eukprot:Rmarinus@m.17590
MKKRGVDKVSQLPHARRMLGPAIASTNQSAGEAGNPRDPCGDVEDDVLSLSSLSLDGGDVVPDAHRTVRRDLVNNWRHSLSTIRGQLGALGTRDCTRDEAIAFLDTMSDTAVATLYGCVTRKTKDLVPGVDGKGELSARVKNWIQEYVRISD